MNQDLLNRIASSPQLPTLPIIAIKVLELTRREDVSVQEIAVLIMNDPALASKILKTVNSPFYGLTKQVSTVSNALVILGLQAVKTLALGFSLLSNLQKGDNKSTDAFDYAQFWRRCIYAAVGSKILAKKMAVIQQEEAFLAGLLSHMGSLVLHRILPTEFDALYAESQGNYPKLIDLCRTALQIDPPEVSALLAEKWQFPQLLSRPIALHFARGETDPVMKPLVDVVSSGVLLADIFCAADSAPAIAAARKELTTRFNLAPDDIEELLEQIGKSARDAAKLLDVPMGPVRGYHEILAEAHETLVALSLQTQHQVRKIAQEVETLQIKATTDPLTGLANRSRFDEFFEEHFTRAYNHERPLSLLFLDIDHFKRVNDTHGHQAGDEVLRAVGRILRAAAREIDLVSRYGGEEFAIVLTETDTNAAAVRAEAIRQAIATEVVPFDDQLLKITISIGVAGTDRTRIFSQKNQLTNAADRAVYAAKAAGRNAVRIFRPRIETHVKLPAHAAPATAKA